MTLPEVLLWQRLRKNPAGVHFRRQHEIGAYFLDFYCAEVKLCIEVDGIAHDMGKHPELDATRDDWLTTQGVEVMRFPAKDVLQSPDEVADAIVRYCLRD